MRVQNEDPKIVRGIVSALHIVVLYVIEVMEHKSWGSRPILLPASCDAGKNIYILGP
jgi:hypothetical protein